MTKEKKDQQQPAHGLVPGRLARLAEGVTLSITDSQGNQIPIWNQDTEVRVEVVDTPADKIGCVLRNPDLPETYFRLRPEDLIALPA